MAFDVGVAEKLEGFGKGVPGKPAVVNSVMKDD
jgi:hypothetical protein